MTSLPATPASATSTSYDLPYDPALPGSRLLQRPEELGGLLASLLANWLGADARLLDTQVDIRRYLPGKRCVVRVHLTLGRGGPAESRRLMIKLYPRDKGHDVHETLRELRTQGFATGHFTVSQPLAYDPTWHLLILDWATGESLGSLLLTRKDWAPALERAARWLLQLHTCGVTGGRPYDFARHLHTLAVQGRHLSEVLPAARRPYSEILHHVEEHGWGMSGWTPAPTHRDFTPEHLLFDGEHVTGLDFDEFCHYDPLFDVGHFLAHLRLIALTSPVTPTDFYQWAEHFQTCYKAGARDYSVPRVRLYQASAYLKLAYVIGAVQRPHNRDHLVTALLREGGRFV